MASKSPAQERKRRLAAGLSPVLLDHAAEGQHFLGFISYRRGDALWLARWLRSQITNFKVPKELKAKIDARDESVGGKQNRVFFDMSYQKPNVDFWDEHIAASLCRSRTLVLLQTPSVFEKLPDGSPNWCEREIETFLKYYGDPSRILVVMGPGAPIDKFPAPLEKISARWDWIDLRFFSQSIIQRFRQQSQYDAQVVKVLAKIYDISDGDLPVLNREFAKARGRVRRNLAVAALATIVALSGLTVWALKERRTAIAQRNSALVSQSRYLASGADSLVKDGTIRGAISLVREGLPDAEAERDRPLVPEAIASAYNAMYSNHERGKLALPAGTTALASDSLHNKIVIATKDQFVVRGGFDSTENQSYPLDFGETVRMVLSPDDKRAALVGKDGNVMLRDVSDGRVIQRYSGEGKNTAVSFIKGGAQLIIADAGYQRLHLIDTQSGAEAALRNLTPTLPKPIVPLFDAQSDLLAVVMDNRLIKLSSTDLSDAATLDIDDGDEYALAPSQDRKTLYVAAAKAILDGRVLEIDAAAWSLKRGFSRIVWGAKKLDVSSRWNTLALIGLNGVDFFDLVSGERTSHVATTFTPTGGQFLGSTEDADYMIYGADGSIRWISPVLGTVTTAFMTIDGGAIKGLDPLPDRTGFISVSDLPSLTRWSYKLVASAADYQVPLINKGVDFKMAAPLLAHEVEPRSAIVLASYTGNATYRWNVLTGASTLVKANDPMGDAITAVAAVGDSAVAVADAAGVIKIYTDKNGPDKAEGLIHSGLVSTLTAVSPSQVFVNTKAGEAELLDASDLSQPKLVPLSDMGPCPFSAAIPNLVICATTKGGITIKRISDGALIYTRSETAPAMTYAEISNDGTRVAISTVEGKLEIHDIASGKVLQDIDLNVDLSGVRLAAALNAGILGPDDMTKLGAGATHLTKRLAATHLAFSPDGKQIAIALPYGVIRLLDIEAGTASDILLSRDTQIISLTYSAHGTLLAIQQMRKAETLNVYRVATRQNLANISLIDQYKAKIYPLPDGQGFLTIGETGHIIVNPVFEKDEDFLAYLAREYPDKLTPAQRRAYFLE